MSILSKEAIAESEIILNKTNIALARSRKLIQSWMTQPASKAEADEDEDDFKPESETAGIGSTISDGNDSSAVAALARSRKATKDKLLEQLLGKKAANAHKKSRDVNTPKPITTSTQQHSNQSDAHKLDEDDDEESRTSALKHSKSKPKRAIDDEPSHPSKSSSTKRKANSYLDELLSKKAKKKAGGTG